MKISNMSVTFTRLCKYRHICISTQFFHYFSFIANYFSLSHKLRLNPNVSTKHFLSITKPISWCMFWSRGLSRRNWLYSPLPREAVWKPRNKPAVISTVGRHEVERKLNPLLQRFQSHCEISRCARNDEDGMKMLLFTQPPRRGVRGEVLKHRK